jgi:hypothetical protein
MRTLSYTFAVPLTQPIATLNALIDSLQSDPFYVAISKEFANNLIVRPYE